ncbi:unnamed protein product, partial [Brassica rapa subsp. narinosa]
RFLALWLGFVGADPGRDPPSFPFLALLIYIGVKLLRFFLRGGRGFPTIRCDVALKVDSDPNHRFSHLGVFLALRTAAELELGFSLVVVEASWSLGVWFPPIHSSAPNRGSSSSILVWRLLVTVASDLDDVAVLGLLRRDPRCCFYCFVLCPISIWAGSVHFFCIGLLGFISFPFVC